MENQGPNQPAKRVKRNERPESVAEMMSAAWNGQAHELMRLLDCGLCANLRNEKGQTPLLLAASQENEDCVRLLIARGADVNAADPDGSTALILAAQNGNDDLARLLVQHGAKVNASNQLGVTVLMCAAAWGRESCVQKLLWCGADVNPTDDHGSSALMYAAEAASAEAVSVLVYHGANVAGINAYGCNALHFVAKSSPLESSARVADTARDWSVLNTVHMLARHRVSFNAADENGNTPLDYFALHETRSAQQASDVFELLVLDGADINRNAENKNRVTALMLLLRRDQSEDFLAAHSVEATLVLNAGRLNRAHVSRSLTEWPLRRSEDRLGNTASNNEIMS
ncbi:putative ankyrin repeat protein [Porphyridium purpureum]|uniref:Putative ankyrin repeat protein n=1 Tax=Porphyridium purpureum TaxID=35688 RepID=A0A5J4YM31_PORPP|nr:putative ankyrin repeat protein [Porphyridium purpureum]|eukprot:POR4468..scf249_10